LSWNRRVTVCYEDSGRYVAKTCVDLCHQCLWGTGGFSEFGEYVGVCWWFQPADIYHYREAISVCYFLHGQVTLQSLVHKVSGCGDYSRIGARVARSAGRRVWEPAAQLVLCANCRALRGHRGGFRRGVPASVTYRRAERRLPDAITAWVIVATVYFCYDVLQLSQRNVHVFTARRYP